MRKTWRGTVLLGCLILNLGLLLAACGETDTATNIAGGTSGAISTTGAAAGSTALATGGAANGANVSVKRMILSRDNTTRDTTTSFSPKDNPLYCIVELNQAVNSVTFKFVWTAVDAGGAQDYKLLEKSVDAKAGETFYNATAKLDKDWPTGSYRVDFYANDVLSKSLNFMVQ